MEAECDEYGRGGGKGFGVNIKRERLLFIAFSTFAVAVATSLCGIIGWVGLMVPHLVRMLTGPDHKTLVPLSISAGAAFMIAADTVSRTLTSFDIPVGIITAITGAPFFYISYETRR
ncbi:MAG: iron chelate uptake ABC transporter family permease subunit [Thermodesulfovibrio sp.]